MKFLKFIFDDLIFRFYFALSGRFVLLGFVSQGVAPGYIISAFQAASY